MSYVPDIIFSSFYWRNIGITSSWPIPFPVLATSTMSIIYSQTLKFANFSRHSTRNMNYGVPNRVLEHKAIGVFNYPKDRMLAHRKVTTRMCIGISYQYWSQAMFFDGVFSLDRAQSITGFHRSWNHWPIETVPLGYSTTNHVCQRKTKGYERRQKGVNAKQKGVHSLGPSNTICSTFVTDFKDWKVS